MKNPKIGVILSTTREGRFADKPARWILKRAARRTDLDCEIVDLREFPLPFFGELSASPDIAASQSDAVARWKRKMAELDGYLFITAEYNHSIPGVLKNALDHAREEYYRKPAAFIGYGGVGAARAVQQLRLICIELQMAPIRHAVHITREAFRAVRQQGKALSDYEYLGQAADAMLADLAWWAQTLRAGRLASTSG